MQADAGCHGFQYSGTRAVSGRSSRAQSLRARTGSGLPNPWHTTPAPLAGALPALSPGHPFEFRFGRGIFGKRPAPGWHYGGNSARTRNLFMPTAPLHAALAYIRRLGAPVGGAGGDDAELLGRFAEHRDESAFAELLRRHGPAVFGVCRRVLADDADAEDAFQATFVVLARRAGEVTRRESVGSFLYGVAVRTALRARSARTKRRARERQVVAMPETAAAPERLWDELRPVLDEELAALPARYREPLRLCYLEGRSYDEAALALGCAKGTVASRVARGRERLRARLAARGVAPSAAGLAAGLAAQTSTSAVPPHLPAAALRAAALARAGAAGLAALAPRVRELAEGAAREAVRARLRVVSVLLLVASVAGLAGVAVVRGRRDPGPETAAVAEMPPAPAARAATWQMAARLGASIGQVRNARFSPDGRTLADVSTDGVLRLWDTATWQERGRFETRGTVQDKYSLRMRFAPDSRLLSLEATVQDSRSPNGRLTAVAVLESGYRPGGGPPPRSRGRVRPGRLFPDDLEQRQNADVLGPTHLPQEVRH